MIMCDRIRSGSPVWAVLIICCLLCGCQHSSRSKTGAALARVCELRDKPSAFVAKSVQTSGWVFTDLETLSLEDFSRNCAINLDYSEMTAEQQSERTTQQFGARLKAAKHGTLDTNGQVFAVVQGEFASYGKWKDKLHPGTFLIRKFLCSTNAPRDKFTESEALAACDEAQNGRTP